MPQSFESPVGFDFSSFWHLQIDNRHPGRGNFTAKTGQVSEIARIEWDYSYDAMLEILGYSYVNNSNKLCRVPPVKHPFWTNMRATAITDSGGVQFTGKTDYNAPGAIPSDADYTYLEVAVTFEPLPFEALPDGTLDTDGATVITEEKRYVSYEYDFTSQFLERPPGNMKWAETGTGGPQTDGGVPINVHVIESHADIAITWHQIPEEYVVDVANRRILPTKWMNAIGKVNSADWLGFNKQTLMMKPPIIKRYPAPMHAGEENKQLFYLDITMMLDYFEPSRGATSPNDRGHQLVPFFSTNNSVTETGYFLVKTNGSAGGAKLYREVDFATLFTHRSV